MYHYSFCLPNDICLNLITADLVLKRVFELRHDKTNNVVVRPAKTQISLGIRPV